MPSNNIKFDVHKLLADIGEGRTLLRVRKKQTIYAQGAKCDALFLYPEGQGKTYRNLQGWQGGDDRYIECRRFLRRRLLNSAAFSHEFCDRPDGLLTHAYRQQGDGEHTSS